MGHLPILIMTTRMSYILDLYCTLRKPIYAEGLWRGMSVSLRTFMAEDSSVTAQCQIGDWGLNRGISSTALGIRCMTSGCVTVYHVCDCCEPGTGK